MDVFSRFRDQFQLVGSVRLDTCPVCDCKEIGELWRLPQNRLSTTAYIDAPGSPMNRTYLQFLPTLETPQSIFKFDICDQCESIFLNPKSDDQEIYARDESKVLSFRTKGAGPFKRHAESYLKAMSPDTKVVVDAACGAGQALYLMREARPDLRLIGLELSKPSVEFMNTELGIEAYTTDLDREDLDPYVAPESVDFIILQEAFEHVRQPLTVMKKLVRMLKPGGRMHFTAQFYGSNPLQIRVGEPIYINDKGFHWVLDQIGMTLIEDRRDIKIRATIEKPA